MGNPGYVYALINPALEGLVKVGKTTNNPEKRANELSTPTGVPMQYMVAHCVIVSDCDLAEKYAHGILEKRGFRVSSNREFFQVPLPEAIAAINSTADFIGRISESQVAKKEASKSKSEPEQFSDWYYLEREARKFSKLPCPDTFDGMHEQNQKAIELWNKAAIAGCVKAYYMQGCLHLEEASILDLEIKNKRTFLEKLFGDDRTYRMNDNIVKGLECHRIAIKNGYELSYAELADYFGNSNNVQQAKKHWDLFFQSNSFRKRYDPHKKYKDYQQFYETFLNYQLNMEPIESNFLAKQKFDA